MEKEKIKREKKERWESKGMSVHMKRKQAMMKRKECARL
jgi:hypothetical protein